MVRATGTEALLLERLITSQDDMAATLPYVDDTPETPTADGEGEEDMAAVQQLFRNTTMPDDSRGMLVAFIEAVTMAAAERFDQMNAFIAEHNARPPEPRGRLSRAFDSAPPSRHSSVAMSVTAGDGIGPSGRHLNDTVTLNSTVTLGAPGPLTPRTRHIVAAQAAQMTHGLDGEEDEEASSGLEQTCSGDAPQPARRHASTAEIAALCTYAAEPAGLIPNASPTWAPWRLLTDAAHNRDGLSMRRLQPWASLFHRALTNAPLVRFDRAFKAIDAPLSAMPWELRAPGAEGQKLCWAAPTLLSRDRGVPLSLSKALGPTRGTLVMVRNVQGHSLGDYTLEPDDREVLLPANATLRIVAAVPPGKALEFLDDCPPDMDLLVLDHGNVPDPAAQRSRAPSQRPLPVPGRPPRHRTGLSPRTSLASPPGMLRKTSVGVNIMGTPRYSVAASASPRRPSHAGSPQSAMMGSMSATRHRSVASSWNPAGPGMPALPLSGPLDASPRRATLLREGSLGAVSLSPRTPGAVPRRATTVVSPAPRPVGPPSM